MAEPVARLKRDPLEEEAVRKLGRHAPVWCKLDGQWDFCQLVQLLDTKPLKAKVVTANGSTREVLLSNVFAANPAVLDREPNLTSLSYLNEPALLHNLRLRYARSDIYTYAGPVLLAVNPFRQIHLYSSEIKDLYRSALSQPDKAKSLHPHVFAVTNVAFDTIWQESRDQSVLISGESGAGKTETTKISLRYLAEVAGGTGIEQRVLETNPLLEAFGNAKTLRNNNSSRFGKLLKIFFNGRRQICGAAIETYLLEKSRVVHQQSGERNFHVFYPVCKGASEGERDLYSLKSSAECYHYLADSGCTTIEGVDDAADFQEIKQSLTAIGVSLEEQQQLFTLLSAILWLGNIEFEEQGSVVTAEQSIALQQAAALLDLCPRALNKALVYKKITTGHAGGEVIYRHLSNQEATDNRDALSKSIYAAIFSWLTERMNNQLRSNTSNAVHSLNILDIYGFECFQDNGFEQLCINYANERLQQQFNRHLFALEQQLYDSEGIDWSTVEFADNEACVQLIGMRPPTGFGLLFMLDEQCRIPQASDETFAVKIRQQHKGHPHVNTNLPHIQFAVRHYAGQVTYTAKGFLDKNKDLLNPELLNLLKGSCQALLSDLVSSHISGNANKRKALQTVGFRFRQQLEDLVTTLDSTGLHFIRCIKPNSRMEAGGFEDGLVVSQLQAGGVMEVTRIAKAGFPTRYTYNEFVDRYGLLIRAELPQDKKDAAQSILAEYNISKAQYRMGLTRLLCKTGVLGEVENKYQSWIRSALYVQSVWRMFVCRREYLTVCKAIITFQAAYRGLRDRRFVAQLRLDRAATRIQSHWRGHVQRSDFLEKKRAAIMVQKMMRRWLAKKRLENLAATILQAHWRGYIERQVFVGKRCAAVIIQSAVRRWTAVRMFEALMSQRRMEALIAQREAEIQAAQREKEAMEFLAKRNAADAKAREMEALARDLVANSPKSRSSDAGSACCSANSVPLTPHGGTARDETWLTSPTESQSSTAYLDRVVIGKLQVPSTAGSNNDSSLSRRSVETPKRPTRFSPLAKSSSVDSPSYRVVDPAQRKHLSHIQEKLLRSFSNDMSPTHSSVSSGGGGARGGDGVTEENADDDGGLWIANHLARGPSGSMPIAARVAMHEWQIRASENVPPVKTSVGSSPSTTRHSTPNSGYINRHANPFEAGRKTGASQRAPNDWVVFESEPAVVSSPPSALTWRAGTNTSANSVPTTRYTLQPQLPKVYVANNKNDALASQLAALQQQMQQLKQDNNMLKSQIQSITTDLHSSIGTGTPTSPLSRTGSAPLSRAGSAPLGKFGIPPSPSASSSTASYRTPVSPSKQKVKAQLTQLSSEFEAQVHQLSVELAEAMLAAGESEGPSDNPAAKLSSVSMKFNQFTKEFKGKLKTAATLPKDMNGMNDRLLGSQPSCKESKKVSSADDKAKKQLSKSRSFNSPLNNSSKRSIMQKLRLAMGDRP